MDIKRLLELAGTEVKGVKDDNLIDALISLFRDKEVTSAEIHNLAKNHNVDIKTLEQVAFKKLSALLRSVGKHKDSPDEKFDPEQLALGVKVEQEHTNDPYIAKIIAKDQLVELPDYYTRLKKMEGKKD